MNTNLSEYDLRPGMGQAFALQNGLSASLSLLERV